jgi:hypothetical protein
MHEFDQLAPNARSLLFATLAMEMAEENCVDIRHLAAKRKQTIDEAWRDVCKRAEQPHCKVPDVISNISHPGRMPSGPSGAFANPARNTRTAEPVTNEIVPKARKPGAAVARGSAAADLPKGPRAATHHKRQSTALVVGLGALVVVVAIGGAMVLFSSSNSMRPAEMTRVGPAPRSAVYPEGSTASVNVPAPQGTVRRMDAIKKAFDK